MKDVIVDAFPDVLGILMNNVLSRYAKAGVKYVEFSVSAKDLLDDDRRRIITDEVFAGDYPRAMKKRPPSLEKKRKSEAEEEQEEQEEQGKYEAKEHQFTFTLPKITKTERLLPDWRNYLNDYHDKAKNQKWNFLAAFNRTTVNTYSPLHLIPKSSTSSKSVKEDDKIDFAVDRLLEHIADIHSDEELYERAELLIEKPSISQMYLKVINKIKHFLDEYLNSSEKTSLNKTTGRMKSVVGLADCVAGIDWVGDEFGFPFCAFTDNDILAKIAECRNTLNPNFGIRIHAGEGLIRFSSVAHDKNSAVGKLFRFHLFVLMVSIRKIYFYFNGINESSDGHELEKCNIRIGHGVAFLYKDETEPDSFFNVKLNEFRKFLRDHHIPCELNPTSNHMLIPATFGGRTVTNDRTLTAFLEEGLPVVLCTDDDGIWAIHKCSCHYHHISVAHEFCDAIQRGEIHSEECVEKLISDGRRYAFANA
jgi:adenosine deaminase